MADRAKKSSPSSEPSGSKANKGWPRWGIWMLMGLLAATLLYPLLQPSEDLEALPYDQFLARVADGEVTEVTVDNQTGRIEIRTSEGVAFTTTGPLELSAVDRQVLTDSGISVIFETPQPGFASTWLPLLLPVGLIILFFVWMNRRAQGQMNGMMSIGRSRAKTYSSENPGTTFDDVAGYDGVKQEIREVVDFLKKPEKFAEVGARVPKGILLVGPPGTGKTLLARAVAGEAGVPFLSVTGSDFMEMFVGVGASRVRDLFETARKMGRAIIFIDELDSIGRKRGAGLGGGHDEREQTLNQMLSEMDGFEASEGIVVLAATNRPDILDPALLRPGRFDRQVVVPLPELSDRRDILAVHAKGKSLADDVDLDVLARGTPGMSGADLANLINEAALIAVRENFDAIAAEHLEAARDRTIMGQKRESMALTASEKEAIAFHEAGHALCAALLPTADPLHKVTIIPSGMALGVTMQLPEEERHIYRQDYIEDSLVVRMGGRIAEELEFGVISTGAQNDLEGATELARKMVREWGMSERIGPMAWSSQGQVFLGDDLMQSRDYSDVTAREIDEEMHRILVFHESRCRDLLTKNRGALNLVARALLEHETISGQEVERLVALAAQPASAGSDDSLPVESSPVD
ncbi:MAG: ATP-dependent zinc metalloprotease FtsH [Actinobacteria bacterium]|nr:ATP-dependent zinc metalloprotease FtsH [Actinomycetota bacterium]MBT3745598.1 ATP-dependent zinc metalloprotease FtsH [Actinomycetota bacterium]MBT3968841.1 ATP-dependent zinc metalloprotease FtsH [Actinomycetota bacterium]MBT4009983.1 ATP-dependent zinc metalloprotease FtsH [Actinomycetota bacterium]MBT4303158.1 ATP-dependent zinc metalloprotease FtsH [Actinomycetota bacterium]